MNDVNGMNRWLTAFGWRTYLIITALSLPFVGLVSVLLTVVMPPAWQHGWQATVIGLLGGGASSGAAWLIYLRWIEPRMRNARNMRKEH